MKKILVIPLIFALALSLPAGCVSRTMEMPVGPGDLGSRGQELEDAKSLSQGLENESAPIEDENEEVAAISVESNWPADKLPPGMPQYPDGELFVSVMDNSVLISVSGANEKSINDYLDALQAAGWDSEEDGAARQGYYVATKGDWRVRISFGDDNLTIMVIQN